MQNSTIIFLINNDARAISAVYEPSGASHTFKTLDQTIQKGDLVVVVSDTRHKMTVVEVDDVDLDINFDTQKDVKWIVQKVDTPAFDLLKSQENDAIAAVQAAERRRKRDELRDTLFADHKDAVAKLALSNTEDAIDDAVTEPPVPPE